MTFIVFYPSKVAIQFHAGEKRAKSTIWFRGSCAGKLIVKWLSSAKPNNINTLVYTSAILGISKNTGSLPSKSRWVTAYARL